MQDTIIKVAVCIRHADCRPLLSGRGSHGLHFYINTQHDLQIDEQS